MPHDRHIRRAVLFATGIVCSTISAGCLTSPFVRRATDPAPESSSTASSVPGDRRDVQHVDPPGRTDSSVRSASVQAADESVTGASLATPFLKTPEVTPSAPAGAFPIELQAAPAETTTINTPGAPESQPPAGRARAAEPAAADRDPPAPASTPLLDAAIQQRCGCDPAAARSDRLEPRPGRRPEPQTRFRPATGDPGAGEEASTTPRGQAPKDARGA